MRVVPGTRMPVSIQLSGHPTRLAVPRSKVMMAKMIFLCDMPNQSPQLSLYDTSLCVSVSDGSGTIGDGTLDLHSTSSLYCVSYGTGSGVQRAGLH